MEWEVIRVDNTSGKNAPFVSIGRGQLDFNAVACQLVNDNGQYKYAQLLKGKDGKKTVIAVKFLENYEDNSILITRKVQNEKVISGMTVRNKALISTLFGKEGANDGMVRYSVEPVGENMLKINY